MLAAMENMTMVYETKVKPKPQSVPFGIALLGCFKSPDMLAPLRDCQRFISHLYRETYANMPPVAGNKTPNRS